MEVYRIQEAEFVIPQEAQDQSIHALAFYSPDVYNDAKPEFSFVITRQEVSETETVQDYAYRQVEQLKQSLQGFALQNRIEISLDNLSAITIEFVWKSEFGPMYQRQTYVRCPVTAGAVMREATKRLMLSLTGTCLENKATAYEITYQQLLYSFRFNY